MTLLTAIIVAIILVKIVAVLFDHYEDKTWARYAHIQRVLHKTRGLGALARRENSRRTQAADIERRERRIAKRNSMRQVQARALLELDTVLGECPDWSPR
jgi:hypothetical protein